MDKPVIEQEVLDELMWGGTGDIVEGYKRVSEEMFMGKSHWALHYTFVIQRVWDESYWLVGFWKGATENQDNHPPEVLHQVKQVERTVTVQTWESV